MGRGVVALRENILTGFINFKTEKLTKTRWIVVRSSRWTVDVCKHATDSSFVAKID